MSNHHVLYASATPDYAFYEADDAGLAEEILRRFETLGAKVCREAQFRPGARIWVAVFSENKRLRA